MPDYQVNEIASSATVYWDSPEAREQYTRLFDEYLTKSAEYGSKYPGWTHEKSQIGAVDIMTDGYLTLKDVAFSTLAASLGALGAAPGGVTVVVENATRTHVVVRAYANGVEAGSVEMDHGPATVERGWTSGVRLTLTPAGSKALWKDGAVINVESN